MEFVPEDFAKTTTAIARVLKAQPMASYYFKSQDLVPTPELRFNAFRLIKSPKNARVIILGQDPYPRKESANGLSFCDARSVLLYDKFQSVSMRNILKTVILHTSGTLCQDMKQVKQYIDGHFAFKNTAEYFSQLAQQCGVFFINASLTYESKEATKKHADFWKPIVLAAIQDCIQQSSGLVLVLFGQFAKQFAGLLDVFSREKVRVVETMHPMNFQFCQSECFTKIQKSEQELNMGVTDWERCCVVK